MAFEVAKKLKGNQAPSPILFSQNLPIKTLRKPFSQKSKIKNANFVLVTHVQSAKIKTCINSKTFRN